jgi:hypothetical protein
MPTYEHSPAFALNKCGRGGDVQSVFVVSGLRATVGSARC